jgi:flagellar L-ring protein precursor FlgH
MKQVIRFVLVVSAMAAAPAGAESLYDEHNYRALAADHRACRVGDVITVQVLESSAASTSTDTTSQRKNNLSAGVGVLSTGKQYGGNLGVAGDFEGGGTTQRTNKLLATLTVSVREVLPGGDLRVAGEQLLTVNEEQHKVSVEGRVRPQDISNDNIVLSTRLADARINYVGEGDLSERQRRGWWRKVLDWLGF